MRRWIAEQLFNLARWIDPACIDQALDDLEWEEQLAYEQELLSQLAAKVANRSVRRDEVSLH